MKYTISVILLSILAGILYLLAAPQYAIANHNAISGSLMEAMTAIPAVVFIITGCGLTLFGTIFGIAFLVGRHNEAHGISSLPSD